LCSRRAPGAVRLFLGRSFWRRARRMSLKRGNGRAVSCETGRVT
jgi:hypothetical protein